MSRNRRSPRTRLTEEGGIVVNTLPFPMCKWLSWHAEMSPLLATYDAGRQSHIVDLANLEILLHAAGFHLGSLEN